MILITLFILKPYHFSTDLYGLPKQNNYNFIYNNISKMAHVKRHIYSTEELIKLDEIVNKANSDVCDAQKKLGQLKRSHLHIKEQHQNGAHKYR